MTSIQRSTLPPVPSLTCKWKGFGGSAPTLGSVEFDRQLDKISIWLEKWDHKQPALSAPQRCALAERLLLESQLRQIQLVWTVIEPAMHRDFMYTARKEFPSQSFTPISTFTTRELKRKVIATRQDNYHRIGSAHLQHYSQVKGILEEEEKVKEEEEKDTCLRLPGLTASMDSSTLTNGLWSLKSQTQRATPRVLRTTQSLTLPRSFTQGAPSVKSSTSSPPFPKAAAMFGGHCGGTHVLAMTPPCLRFIEMPVRRHIQDEESPRVREASFISNVSLAASLSLRERKKRKLKAKKPLKNVPKKPLSKEAEDVLNWYSDQWNGLQRNEFLHKFLLKLDPRQHYFISSLLSIRQYRDFLALLPEHLSLKILSYLHPIDLLKCSRTSKKWHELCNANSLWKLKCQDTRIEIPVEIKSAGSEGRKEPDWKRIFKENLYVKQNWREGKCGTIDCRGHTDKVLSVTFDRKRLATGSQDKTIRIWSLRDGRCLQTLQGHTKGIWSLRFFAKNLLVSGSYDSTIRIWNLNEGTSSRTLLSHEGPVWALVLKQHILVSGSQDKTAKVWDIGRCLLLHTLAGHGGAVFAVDMDDQCRMAFTGSADKTVRIWLRESGELLKVVHASASTSIMAVSYSAGHLACSFGDTIHLYSVQRDQLVLAFQEHQMRIESLSLRVKGLKDGRPIGHIVSAGKDGELKYWDISKPKSVHTYKGSNKAINCIHCDQTRIATAAYDNRVKIYDFNVA